MVGPHGTAGHTKGTLFTRGALYFNSTFFKGEIVLPGTVAKSSLKQEDLCNQRKQLYLTYPILLFLKKFLRVL